MVGLSNFQYYYQLSLIVLQVFAMREGKASHGNHKKSVTGEIREMGTTLTTNNDKFNDIMVKVIKIVG
jgi:hypothetical protein